MVLPTIIVLYVPFGIGLLFNVFVLIGCLIGIIISGTQLGISMNNSGGAWDNAKKLIETETQLDKEGNIIKK